MPSVTFKTLLFGGSDSPGQEEGTGDISLLLGGGGLLARLGLEFTHLGRGVETVKWESDGEPTRFRVVLFLLTLAYFTS